MGSPAAARSALTRRRASSPADEEDAGGAAVGMLQAALQDQQRRLSVACAQTAEYASASPGRRPKAKPRALRAHRSRCAAVEARI